MGIEAEIEDIKDTVNTLLVIVGKMENRMKDIDEKVDLLTIRKQVDRQDKEKRIKDTMPCVERQVDTL